MSVWTPSTIRNVRQLICSSMRLCALAKVPASNLFLLQLQLLYPGVWFMHCHLELHVMWGLNTASVFENGKRKNRVFCRRRRTQLVKLLQLDIMASNSYGTLSLRHILDTDNLLRGPNYLEWLRKLKIVLRHERKLYVLEEADPVEPVKGASEAEEKAYQKFLEDSIDVQCIMLSAMIPDLQKQHEHMSAKDIDAHLRDLFQENARVERYNTSRALFNCKMQEASSVESHVLKMIGYIERLGNLGVAMDQDLTMDLILSSLPESFSQFIMNFNMNDMKKTLPDLLAMLRTAEKDIKISKPAKQSSQVLLVDKNKRKGKGKEIPKAKKAKTENKPKKGVQKPVAEEKEAICFHCGKKGHWKRNCTVFLEKKKKDAESSGTK